jgi:hypothetical protein
VAPSRNLDGLLSALRNLTADIFTFNEVFTNLGDSDFEQVRVPMALVNAWMHIVLSLATFPTDSRRCLDLAERAKLEMKSVMNQVIDARSKPLDLHSLVVLPFDLVSLIGMKLSRDITPGLPDISATYGSYLNSIVSNFIVSHHIIHH